MTNDLRLAPAAAGVWISAAAILASPGSGRAVPVLLWCVVLTVVIVWIVAVEKARRGRHVAGLHRMPSSRGTTARRVLRQWLPAAVLALAASASSATMAIAADDRRHPDEVDAVVSEASRQEFRLTVDTATAVRAGSGWHSDTAWFDASLQTWAGRTGAADLASTVRVRYPLDSDSAVRRVPIGSQVMVVGRLVAAPAGRGYGYVLAASSTPEVEAPAPWYLGWGHDLRTGFSRAAANLPGDAGQLLPGLAIGDTSSVSDELDDAMKTASLSHLTAVSGANCTLVVAGAVASATLLGAGRRTRLLCGLVVLVAFVVLVTPEPSVVRAAMMAAVVLIATGLVRRLSGSAALMLAIILLVLIDPAISLEAGFLLSVAATAGLLFLAPVLSARLAVFMPRPVATMLAIPIAAQLVCQPILIIIEPSLPVYGVVANLVAEPAAPVATVVGLLACVLLAVAPPIGTVVMVVAAAPAWWIASVARTASGLPFATVPWMPGVGGLVLLAVVTAAALHLLLAPRSRSGESSRRWPRSVRVMAVIVVAVVVPGYASVLATLEVRRATALPSDWTVLACDVGQGDAVLVRSAGRVALVDTGPDPAALSDCLGRVGISTIDLLVLSHYDADHIGGLPAVVGRTTTALVGPPDRASDERALDDLRDGGADVIDARAGDSGTLGDASWAVHWPDRETSLRSNAASLVWTVDTGGLRVAFLGDLGAEEQGRIAVRDTVGQVDVVKVAHHGSSDQDARLYDRLAARIAIVSVGADNDYGHPTASALTMLARAGSEIARTDTEGIVAVSGTAPSLVLWREHQGVSARPMPFVGFGLLGRGRF